jgi:hypothetical protein
MGSFCSYSFIALEHLNEGGDLMGITMIKISTVYFAAGVLLGYYMSSTHSYLLAPFHVPINLLGWTSLTLQSLLFVSVFG